METVKILFITGCILVSLIFSALVLQAGVAMLNQQADRLQRSWNIQ